MDATQPPMMTVGQVARTFTVSASHIYRMVRRNELPAVRIGGAIRVPRTAVEAMLCPAPTEAPISGDPPNLVRGTFGASLPAEPAQSRRAKRIEGLLRLS
jgi:excisionase family DNA binding protein